MKAPIETSIKRKNDFLITVCCGCQRVQTADGEWQDAPDLLELAPRSVQTHTMCPDCVIEYYPDTAARLGLIPPPTAS